MMRDGKRVLVVDDEARARQETARVVEQAGFPVVQACDGLHALSEMQKRRGDVVVADCHMRHLNGRDFLAQSRVIWPDTPVILYSETRDRSDMAAARGACAWIRQSSDASVLLNMLAMALEPGVEWTSRPAMQRVSASEAGNSDLGRNETGHRPVIASNVAGPVELASGVCPSCVMADVHITFLCPAQNFDRENASGEVPETHGNLFKMLGGGDSRGPRN
jgi:two-component system chemotaxis response regulator CheY